VQKEQRMARSALFIFVCMDETGGWYWAR